MTQTTSGIEPVFMPVYKRRRKVNPNDKEARIDFVDEMGDSWEEYIVFHHKFKVWMETKGYKTNKKYSNEEIDELVNKSPVSYTHLRAHETGRNLVCRLLLEKKK